MADVSVTLQYLEPFKSFSKKLLRVNRIIRIRNIWNHLTVGKKSSGKFRNVINKVCLQIIYI